MSAQPESSLRVAAIQMEPRVGRKEANVARSLALMAEAAQGGAQLVGFARAMQFGLRVRNA